MSQAIQIKKGYYSVGFQVARAHLSAASAVAPGDPKRAAKFVDAAIAELGELKAQLIGGRK